jgi:hypothetical protein
VAANRDGDVCDPSVEASSARSWKEALEVSGLGAAPSVTTAPLRGKFLVVRRGKDVRVTDVAIPGGKR